MQAIKNHKRNEKKRVLAFHLRIPVPVWAGFLVLSVFGFGGLLMVADEVLGTGLAYGWRSLYYFPVLGGEPIWSAWILVFTGLGVVFFLFGLAAFKLGSLTVKHQAFSGVERTGSA